MLLLPPQILHQQPQLLPLQPQRPPRTCPHLLPPCYLQQTPPLLVTSLLPLLQLLRQTLLLFPQIHLYLLLILCLPLFLPFLLQNQFFLLQNRLSLLQTHLFLLLNHLCLQQFRLFLLLNHLCHLLMFLVLRSHRQLFLLHQSHRQLSLLRIRYLL